MDFSPNPELVSIREIVRKYLSREIAPLIPECEEKETFPLPLVPGLGALGVLAIGAPEPHGGMPGGLAGQAVVLEELARVSAGTSSAISITGYLLPKIIFELGTEDQIRDYAMPLIQGRKIGGFSLTEPDAGSDVRGIKTRAEREGDHYSLNGSKVYTTNAPIADFFVVIAYTDRSKGVDGMSMFLVDVATPGLTVAPKYRKESIRTAETSGLFLEHCKVPASALLGGEGTGFRRVMRTLNADRIYNAARSIGIASVAFEAAKTYAKQRTQFGRPIGNFQAVGFKLAEMATKIDCARLMIDRATWLYDSGQPFVTEISMAKLFTSEMCGEVTRDALQIHGGAGIMRDSFVGRYVRDALLSTIGAGTSEIQRRILARQMGFQVD